MRLHAVLGPEWIRASGVVLSCGGKSKAQTTGNKNQSTNDCRCKGDRQTRWQKASSDKSRKKVSQARRHLSWSRESGKMKPRLSGRGDRLSADRRWARGCNLKGTEKRCMSLETSEWEGWSEEESKGQARLAGPCEPREGSGTWILFKVQRKTVKRSSRSIWSSLDCERASGCHVAMELQGSIDDTQSSVLGEEEGDDLEP